MKRIIKDYFTFSKKERVAITVLLLLIACFIAMPYFYPAKHKPPPVNKALAAYLSNNKKTVEETEAENAGVYHSSRENKEKIFLKKESFPFDPNTITQEEWRRLGLPEKTVRTIMNYRNKGGQFRKAEDINRIWGIKKEDAERLVPLVTLAKKPVVEKKVVTPTVRKQIVPIEINTATEEEWKALPGIGEVLARRILKFREHAGGFMSIDQVRKTYGLADSVFQQIAPYLKLDDQLLPKIDLNLVSAYDLKRKLNVDDAAAKTIIIYRKRNGPFHSLEDLKKNVLISDTMFLRIAPFLKIN